MPKLFQKLQKEEHSQIFSEATITLIPNPDKNATKSEKSQANITDEHRHKNPQEDTNKQNPRTYLKDHTT